MNTPESIPLQHLQTARHLWFGGYHGILSTHSIALPGYPFGSLVPFSRDSDGLPILLLSHLAQHTCNLNNNPHCSLLLQEKGDGDVQQLGRLTCLAQAEKIISMNPETSERYFRFHPDTRTYYEDLNFNFYRLKPVRFYFVGGFGAARWFDISKIIPACRLTDEEESRLIIELGVLSRLHSPHSPSATIVGVDCMGVDLRAGERIGRLMLPEPVPSPYELLRKLESKLASSGTYEQNRN